MLESLLADSALMIMATGALVGSAATLVGVFLVLRRNSMLSDAISHSIVFGIVVVWLLTRQQSGPVQLVGAALSGVLTVFLTELLVNTRKVKDDAAIGLVFPALFSIGVLLLNLGTPEGTDYWSMRRYLREFLSDDRVIDVNPLLWRPLLHTVILTTRPARSTVTVSASAYTRSRRCSTASRAASDACSNCASASRTGWPRERPTRLAPRPTCGSFDATRTPGSRTSSSTPP